MIRRSFFALLASPLLAPLVKWAGRKKPQYVIGVDVAAGDIEQWSQCMEVYAKGELSRFAKAADGEWELLWSSECEKPPYVFLDCYQEPA